MRYGRPNAFRKFDGRYAECSFDVCVPGPRIDDLLANDRSARGDPCPGSPSPRAGAAALEFHVFGRFHVYYYHDHHGHCEQDRHVDHDRPAEPDDCHDHRDRPTKYVDCHGDDDSDPDGNGHGHHLRHGDSDEHREQVRPDDDRDRHRDRDSDG